MSDPKKAIVASIQKGEGKPSEHVTTTGDVAHAQAMARYAIEKGNLADKLKEVPEPKVKAPLLTKEEYLKDKAEKAAAKPGASGKH